MKWRIIIVVKVLCIVSVCTVPVVGVQPDLTLFPESTTPIVDNSYPDDEDPQVDVIVVTDIPVPETNGQLLFSGKVQWDEMADTGGKIENATLVITDATIKNITIKNSSPAPFQLPTDRIIVVAHRGYPSWGGANVVGQIGFDGELSPPGAFTSPTQRLTVTLHDSGVDFLVPPPDRIDLNAKWIAGTGDPWKMTASAKAAGTTTTGLNTMWLFLSEIIIGGDQKMYFPNSITAKVSSSEVKPIPAVSAGILTALALLLAASGGILIANRHRALGQ